MSDFTFKPFQQVLVRDHDNQCWRANYFSHMELDFNDYVYITGDSRWRQCIPFNEDTHHLIGTSDPYTPPVDEATRFKRGELVEVSVHDDINQLYWTNALYLEYEKGSGTHRVFYSKIENICNQEPHEIRKKQGKLKKVRGEWTRA